MDGKNEKKVHEKKGKQAQRRSAMDRRMQYIIPNEIYDINHNVQSVPLEINFLNLPSISTLRYLMKKFERAGGAKYSWKGKKSVDKEETVKHVARLYVARRLSLR